MTTRQEIHRQQEAASNQRPFRPRHPMRIFWGVVALVLFGFTLLCNQTILNKHFAEQEVQRSDLASTVDNNLNQVAGRYGIDDGVLDTSATNKLLRQAIDQIYAGKQLNLDFSSTIQKSTSSSSPSIDGVQIPKGLLSSSIGSAATEGVSSALNQQINTPEVQRFTNILQIWKNINNVVMIISGILLIVVLLTMIIGRASLGSFSRLVGISAVLLVIINQLIKTMVINIGRNFPGYSSLIVQVANDISQVGFRYCIALIVVFVLLMIVGIVTHGIRRRI